MRVLVHVTLVTHKNLRKTQTNFGIEKISSSNEATLDFDESMKHNNVIMKNIKTALRTNGNVVICCGNSSFIKIIKYQVVNNPFGGSSPCVG